MNPDQNIFFVCGLPRSRTAWLANYLSFGETVCMHDFFKSLRPPADLVSVFANLNGKSVGISDPMNVSFQDQLIELFPTARWLIIERDFASVRSSCRKASPGSDTSLLHYLHEKTESLRGKLDGGLHRTLTFEQLDDDYSLQEVSSWLAPGFSGHTPERWELLRGLNVQVHAPFAAKQIAELEGRADGLLRMMEPLSLSEATNEYLSAVRSICEVAPGAWEWFQSTLETALVWDHIADGDPCNPALADRVFTAITTEWPLNPFLAKYATQLVPVMVNARSAWQHSNEPSSSKARAYDLYTEVPSTMAWIIGGNHLVNEAMPRIRSLVSAILAEDETRDRNKK